MVTDYLFEEDLSTDQQALQRILSELPTLSDMGNLGRVRDGLRRVLVDELNYEFADRPVRGLGDQLSREIDSRVVASRNDFDIIHIHLPELRASIERPAVERIVRNHPQCMIVATSYDPSDLGAWHFINVKEAAKGRKAIRRAIVEPPFVGRTVLQTLWACLIDGTETALQIAIKHENSFEVREVTREFYRDYAQHFERIRETLQSNHDIDRKQAEETTQELLNRLLFLSFIQRKDWMGLDVPDRSYLWNGFRRHHLNAPEEDSYHREFLTPLFAALSMKRGTRGRPALERVVGNVPFLNGGLFEVDDSGAPPRLTLKNRDFQLLFEDLLLRYNFTIREDTPLDQELAVDPEMLGRIFETLILEKERKQDLDLRKATGSYYTPREVVHFLCQQALLRWLDQTAGLSEDALNALRDIQTVQGFSSEDVDRISDLLSIPQCEDIYARVKDALVVDPAVGSGAFLLAMLHEMLSLARLMDARVHGSDVLYRQNYDYDLKTHFIQHCLYGVDIQPRAVRICELRLWLSLVVDYEGTEIPPLPNLTYRVKVGDALVEHLFGQPFNLIWVAATEQGRRLVDEFTGLKGAHALTTDVVEKRRLELRILEKQCELAEMAINERRSTRGSSIAMEGILAASDNVASIPLEELNRLLQMTQDVRQMAIRLYSRSRPPTEDDIRGLYEQMGFNFVWRLDFAEVWRRKGGFDIAVSNPPYVRIQNLSKDDVANYRRLFRSATRNYDIYVLFDEAGFNLLNSKGIMAFIQGNKFLTTDYGSGLRSWISERNALQLLVDFGDVQIFDATIYTCLVFVSPIPASEFQYARLDQGERQDIFNTLAEWTDFTEEIQFIPSVRINGRPWLLDRPEAANVWIQLINDNVPLSHVAERIFQGV